MNNGRHIKAKCDPPRISLPAGLPSIIVLHPRPGEADILCEGHFGVFNGKAAVRRFIAAYLVD
jgi:hypothetical protein